MLKIIDISCSKCLNYIGLDKCAAFNQIPKEILSGKNKHLKPLPKQDNDIIFEPIKNKA